MRRIGSLNLVIGHDNPIIAMACDFTRPYLSKHGYSLYVSCAFFLYVLNLSCTINILFLE